jgi:outer membrane protein OmpA-like peptidoglycan-associated protein
MPPTDTADGAGTTVTTETTTTRTVEGHVWERSRKGVALPVAAGLLGLAALGLGQGWPQRHSIESELDDRSTAALQDAGISGVDVSFEGRDGIVTGTVATEADRNKVLGLVEAQTGVRVAVNRLTVTGAPGGGTEPGGTPPPSASVSPSPSPSESQSPSATVAPTTPAAVSLSVKGGKVTLVGAVPDAATKQSMIDAAAALVGAGNVVDQLTIDAAVSPDGLAGLPGVLAALGKDAAVDVTLKDGAIGLDGTVGSEAARAAALKAAEAVVGDAAKVRDGLTVRAGSTGSSPVASQLKALPRITFETGSATLTPAGRAAVRRAAAILKANPDVKVLIQGHTDNRGTTRVNQELSAARARTVLLTLRGQGIARNRLTAKGYGESRPLVPNSTAANRLINRRVVFAVVQ